MKKKSELSYLKNIGPTIEKRLNEINIYTRSALEQIGPVKAYQWICRNYPDKTIPVCYYLYSLQGALLDVHWDKVPKKMKDQLNIETKKLLREVAMQAVKSTNFFPVLTTTKLIECRNFYSQYFGFTVVFETDWYIHLASETGIQLGFLQPNHPTQPDFLQTAYGGSGLIYSFEVDDIDQEYEKLKKSEIPILLQVRTEEWGQRHFMIKDPSGMVIDVIQHAEPTDEYKDKSTG